MNFQEQFYSNLANKRASLLQEAIIKYFGRNPTQEEANIMELIQHHNGE